jgi:hypothetical protein
MANEPEIFRTELEVHKCVRYIYLDSVVPFKDFADRKSDNPTDVEPVNGAVGFDFISVIYFDFEGRTLRHILGEAETFYWGQELSREELETMSDMGAVLRKTDAERFLLSSWGGIIPLKAHEFAIAPNFSEALRDFS